MTRGRDDFENVFDHAFENAFQETAVPGDFLVRENPLPSWVQLQPRINRIKRGKLRRDRKMRVAIVAASILLGAGLFGNTQAAKAIPPFYESLQEYSGQLTGFFFGRPDESDSRRAKTVPPPGNSQAVGKNPEGGTREVRVTAEEAKRRLSFAAPIFGYLPAHVAADEVYLYYDRNRETAEHVVYHFKNPKGKLFQISFRRLAGETSTGMNSPAEGVSEPKTGIGGKPAVVIISSDGIISLQVVRRHILIHIAGKLTEKEAVNILQNIQNAES